MNKANRAFVAVIIYREMWGPDWHSRMSYNDAMSLLIPALNRYRGNYDLYMAYKPTIEMLKRWYLANEKNPF